MRSGYAPLHVPVSGVFLSTDGPDIKWISSGVSLIVLCTSSSNRALEIDPRFNPLRNLRLTNSKSHPYEVIY
jgi:hypothetical protein